MACTFNLQNDVNDRTSREVVRKGKTRATLHQRVSKRGANGVIGDRTTRKERNSAGIETSVDELH
jgi:hypothetical protein